MSSSGSPSARFGMPTSAEAFRFPQWEYPFQGKVDAASSYKRVWWALSGQNVGTVRKYAVKALLREPYTVESWRAMYCAVRGH